MALPHIPGVKIGIKVTAPTPEIKQQVQEELAKVMIAAGYGPGPTGSIAASAAPSRPALRVIKGDRQ